MNPKTKEVEEDELDEEEEEEEEKSNITDVSSLSDMLSDEDDETFEEIVRSDCCHCVALTCIAGAEGQGEAAVATVRLLLLVFLVY